MFCQNLHIGWTWNPLLPLAFWQPFPSQLLETMNINTTFHTVFATIFTLQTVIGSHYKQTDCSSPDIEDSFFNFLTTKDLNHQNFTNILFFFPSNTFVLILWYKIAVLPAGKLYLALSVMSASRVGWHHHIHPPQNSEQPWQLLRFSNLKRNKIKKQSDYEQTKWLS